MKSRALKFKTTTALRFLMSSLWPLVCASVAKCVVRCLIKFRPPFSLATATVAIVFTCRAVHMVRAELLKNAHFWKHIWETGHYNAIVITSKAM